MKKVNLKSQIESILLASEKPVKIKELATVLDLDILDLEKELESLTKDYKERGIRIIRKEDEVHFATAGENAEIVGKFLNEEIRGDLTRPALEVLAIVTYKQPITRIEIEEMRGVSSDYLLKTLLLRGLIKEMGRKEAIGKPILYGTTIEFLNHFGFESEDDIPEFEDAIQVDTITI